MKARRIASAFTCVLALAGAAAINCSAYAGPRAVIELFTSQGCSSCPTADKLLGELADDPSVLTLTLAVDYWDYLGWKDTLALQGHGKRQRAYAEARGDRAVYTPQAVINGSVHVLGSDRNAIESAMAESAKKPSILKVPVSAQVSGNSVVVKVDGLPDATGEIWLCPVTDKITVTVGRGENRGKNITYSHVVRRWVKLGDWNGQAQSFTVPVASLAGADHTPADIDRLAVLVQGGGAGKPGPMLGAAMVGLR